MMMADVLGIFHLLKIWKYMMRCQKQMSRRYMFLAEKNYDYDNVRWIGRVYIDTEDLSLPKD